MRLALTGRHVEITPPVRKLVDRKLAKLARTAGDAVVSVQVVLTREKNRRVVELMVHTRGDHILHGTSEYGSWDRSLTTAVEKILHQATKVKDKWRERKRRAAPVKTVAPGRAIAVDRGETSLPRILRTRPQAVKPMTVEDAARAVGIGEDGIVVFFNAATGAMNVLYRRKNGDLGIIELEA